MLTRWSEWKCYPDVRRGEVVEAPSGPGVYEVCDASTRERIAFGCAPDVAQTLSAVLSRGGRKLWLFRWTRRRSDADILEYRAWPTATLADAKMAVGQIIDKRGALIRRYAQSVRV
jgi:hypothetical protein